MEILSLKAAGFRHREIAKAAGVSRSTIQRLLNLFSQAGLEGVREFHEQGPTSALAEHAASLGEEFRLRPPSSSAEADCTSRPANPHHDRLGQCSLSALSPSGRFGGRVANRATFSSVVLAEFERD